MFDGDGAEDLLGSTRVALFSYWSCLKVCCTFLKSGLKISYIMNARKMKILCFSKKKVHRNKEHL